MSHLHVSTGYCFGETQILVALLVVAIIIAIWMTGNLESPFAEKRHRHHPAQGVQWVNNPVTDQAGVSVGYAPNGDTVIGVPASSTVTASNTTLSDPLNPTQDSISIAPLPAQPLPEDSTVTATSVDVESSQADAHASLETVPTPTNDTPVSYFAPKPQILMDANGDPLPLRFQRFLQ